MPDREALSSIYAAEKLPPPGILGWPLAGNDESDRKKREERLHSDAGNLPVGLQWMASHLPSKYRPDRVLPGCRSVLVSGLGYFRNDPIDDEEEEGGLRSAVRKNAAGRIARYARGRDYHKELGNRLRRISKHLSGRFPEHSFRAFTDIGPLDEVWLAEASGLGFRGRNGLAILPGVGSWAVLGHILSTVPFSDGEARRSPLACPESCRRCIDACPTGALSPPGRMDAARCISYHGIEHPGPVPNEFRRNAGDRVFGCDVCQEVCPFNRRAELTAEEGFLRDIAGDRRLLIELLELKNHGHVVEKFAGSPLMRAGRSGLVRNACTAAGNSRDRRLIPLLEGLLDDTDVGVRSHARWALAELDGRKECGETPSLDHR